MIIEEALFAYLSTYAGLAALMSDRLYPLVLPETPTLPAATYKRISTPRTRSHSGPSGHANPRFQIDCWAATFLAAKAVANQFRAALDGYNATMGGVSGVDVQMSLSEDERDFYDEEMRAFRVSLDFILSHAE